MIEVTIHRIPEASFPAWDIKLNGRRIFTFVYTPGCPRPSLVRFVVYNENPGYGQGPLVQHIYKLHLGGNMWQQIVFKRRCGSKYVRLFAAGSAVSVWCHDYPALVEKIRAALEETWKASQ